MLFRCRFWILVCGSTVYNNETSDLVVLQSPDSGSNPPGLREILPTVSVGRLYNFVGYIGNSQGTHFFGPGSSEAKNRRRREQKLVLPVCLLGDRI